MAVHRSPPEATGAAWCGGPSGPLPPDLASAHNSICVCVIYATSIARELMRCPIWTGREKLASVEVLKAMLEEPDFPPGMDQVLEDMSVPGVERLVQFNADLQHLIAVQESPDYDESQEGRAAMYFIGRRREELAEDVADYIERLQTGLPCARSALLPVSHELASTKNESVNVLGLRGPSCHAAAFKFADAVLSTFWGAIFPDEWEPFAYLKHSSRPTADLVIDHLDSLHDAFLWLHHAYGGANDYPSAAKILALLEHEISKAAHMRSLAQTQPTPCLEGSRVILRGRVEGPIVLGKEKRKLTTPQYNVVKVLLDVGDAGVTKDELVSKSGHEDARGILGRLADSDPDWKKVIHFAGQTGGGYRIK